MPRSDTSLAYPQRLVLNHDDDGDPFHELAGERLERGTLLQLRLSDDTWLTGVYDWDQEPSAIKLDLSKPPVFRIYLAAAPAAGAKPVGGPAGDEEDLAVALYLPADAALRVHPRWRQLTRAPRRRRRRGPPSSSVP